MGRSLPRIIVSPERVVRIAVGVRPFRRAGFSVRREALGQKLLVHNYGHGGAGYTLSRGCAVSVAELVGPASAGLRP